MPPGACFEHSNAAGAAEESQLVAAGSLPAPVREAPPLSEKSEIQAQFVVPPRPSFS